MADIFVHFPKTGGRAVHATARANGRPIRSSGHHPAATVGPGPAWAVLRDPVEWYVSIYRFCVDAGWSVLPDLAGTSFPAFVLAAKPTYYDDYCRALAVETVDHLYRYPDLQAAYHRHVGPDTLVKTGVSTAPRPEVTPALADAIRENNPVGVALYDRLARV